MKTKKSNVMKNRNIILTALVLLVPGMLILMGAGQFPEWNVPADKSLVKNPVALNDKALSNGRTLFETQCKACHGPKGLGDGAIPAANLVSEATQSQSDGAIFWKLQQGRGQMPSFAALPPEQLWEIILYIRSLANPVEPGVKKKTQITLQLMEKDSVKTVLARVFELGQGGIKMPLSDKKVLLGVKRMFGILPLQGNGGYTNNEGVIRGEFPADLPADTAGNIIIIAYVDDPAFEPGTVEQSAPWGQSWTYTDITHQRSLWARMKYAPIWLLVSFTLVAGAIWLTIVWVLLELKKINDKGKKFAKEQV
jgi:mono/diheme cytochrome c family protein